MTDESLTAPPPVDPPTADDMPVGVTPRGACGPHHAPHPQSSPCGRFLVIEETAADAAVLSEGGAP